MRQRYGDGQPVGREGAIMARTDLDDDQKLEFLIRARANQVQPTRDERMARKANREARYGSMRQEQMAARMAPMQQAMMMQMMNQNPELALRLLDLQQRGQATAAQMGLAQQRLGLDRELGLGELGMGQARLGLDERRLDSDTRYRDESIGIDRERLGLEGRRLDSEDERFERQLDLDERLGDAGITARDEANAIARLEAERSNLDSRRI